MEGKLIRQGAIWVLSTALVAGCAAGSSRDAGGAQTVMVSAAARSEAASTFHISATEMMTSISGTPYLPVSKATLSGDVDLSTHSAHFEATMDATSFGSGPKDLSFETIEIGRDTWASTSGLGGMLGLGALPPGHWIRDDSSSSISQVPDPAQLFEALRSKATNVHLVGTATVNGAACNEYELSGSPDLLDALGGSSSDQSLQTGPVSVQVWVDRSHLVRRLSTTVKQNMGPPGQVESMEITADFTNYGEHVHIDPPPSNLVVPNP